MEDNLPGGRDSSISLFAKIKGKLSGASKVTLGFLALIAASLLIFATYVLLSPNISLKDILKKVAKPGEQTNGENNISEPFKTIKPLAHGKQSYTISGSKTGAPKPTQAVIDPIDPLLNSSQIVTVKVLAAEGGPVTKVNITLTTDNKTKTYPLTLSEGTNLDGVWKGTLAAEDSYDYRYQMAIAAENANDSWTVTLTFR